MVDLLETRPKPDGNGGYVWEADLRIRCDHGLHVVTIDPNGELPCTSMATFAKRVAALLASAGQARTVDEPPTGKRRRDYAGS